MWHEVTWFGFGFEGWVENEVIDGIQIYRKFRLSTGLFVFYWYYRKHFVNQFDLIIDEAGGFPLLSPLFERKIPIIFLIHHIGDKEWDFALPFPFSTFWKWVYFALIKLYYRKSCITVSKSTADELISRFGFTPSRIKVIENACDIAPLETVNFEKKQKDILFLWRLTPIKRVEDAIKAFDYFVKFAPSGKDFHLNIIGNAQDKKYVQGIHYLITSLELTAQVHLVGHIPRSAFREYMMRHQVILVPSMKEGFWLIVLEANSYGMPAIGYDVAGLRDSIMEGVNGSLVPDGDYISMGEKLIELLENETALHALSDSSLKHVKSLENWDQKTNTLEVFLREQLK